MTVQIWPARYIPVAINDNSRKYVRIIMYSTDTKSTSFSDIVIQDEVPDIYKKRDQTNKILLHVIS